MKKDNGITLIALIITIIIIVLLATISINAAIGDDGILNRALSTREKEHMNLATQEIQDAVRRMEYYEITNADVGLTIDNIFSMSTLQKYLAGKLNGLYKKNDEYIIYYTNDNGTYTLGITDGEITTAEYGIMLFENTINMIQMDVNASSQLFSEYGMTTWIFSDDVGNGTSQYSSIVQLNPDGTFKKIASGTVKIKGWNEDRTKYIEITIVDEIPQLEPITVADSGDDGTNTPIVEDTSDDTDDEPVPPERRITAGEYIYDGYQVGDNVYVAVNTPRKSAIIVAYGEGTGAFKNQTYTYDGGETRYYLKSFLSMTLKDGCYYDENGSIYFDGIDEITTLQIQDGVTEFTNKAFWNFTNVKFLTIPSTVTKYGGEQVFGHGSVGKNYTQYGMSNVDTIYWNANEITDYSAYAHYHTGVKNFVIGNNVVKLQDKILYYCQNITSLNIPSNVNSIGEMALAYCGGLSTITFNEGLETIGSWCINCTGLSSVSLPNSLRSIGNRGIYNNNLIGNINLGNGVEVLGDYCLQANDLVSEITIPSSVKIIGKGILSGSLTKIYYNAVNATYNISGDLDNAPGIVYNYVVSSNQYARYANDDDYNHVEIRQNGPNQRIVYTYRVVPRFTTHSHYNYYGGGNHVIVYEYYDHLVQGNSYYDSHYQRFVYTYYYSVEGRKTTNHSDVKLYIYDFEQISNNSVTEIVVGDGVEQIPNGIFKGLNALTTVTIPDSCKKIGSDAFKDCVSLTNLSIGNGLESISNKAFKNCVSLRNISLPNSINMIGNDAFENCYGMQTINIDNTEGSIDHSPWGMILQSNAGDKTYTYRGEEITMYAPGVVINYTD